MAATKHIQTEGQGAPYRVPPEPNRWPAIGMAVGVHALLIAFLAIGVNWQNHEPIAVEAEVWDVNTQTAAPPPPAPQPQPAPEPAPEPDTPPPPPQPVPKAVEPPPPPVEQPQVKQPKAPDIALEREKKRKEELKRKQQEEERIERERELEQEKRADEKKARALAEKKEREREQKQAEQKARDEAEKKAQDQAKKEAADKKKKAEKEKAEKLAKDKAEAAKLDKARADEMKRMMSAAGNTGSTGNAEKSTAPRRDNGYIAAITAKVKGNAHYGGSLDEAGNPTVSFHVEQLPTGEIISVKMTRSSGIPSFDDAVKRAIENSSPLPKKKDGTVERSLEINFHMKDMQ